MGRSRRFTAATSGNPKRSWMRSKKQPRIRRIKTDKDRIFLYPSSSVLDPCHPWLTALYFLDLFGEYGHCFEQISDNPIIRNIENRRLGIFVDGDDCPGVLHP